MNVSYISLSSGSSGNCHVVSIGAQQLMVDCGLPGRAVQSGLHSHGLEIEKLQGILITHEHTDHIKGVGILSRKADVPIYATEKTWQAMERHLGKLNPKNIRLLEPGKALEVGDLEVRPFSTSHDAADPVGYRIGQADRAIGIATDLGVVSASVREALTGCRMVVLEANHDVDMLKMGSYPYALKRRVLSEIGHLSNQAAADLLAHLVHTGSEVLCLAHLSHENNIPVLAYQTVASTLQEQAIDPLRDARLLVLERRAVSGKIGL